MNYNDQYNINNISTNIHNKLFDKYLNYLELNKNNKNIKLKGNYKYNNMPISYYLNNPNFPITNNNLTPLPINKKNNIKNNNIKKKNNNMQKNIISMRRMEYNYKLKNNNNNNNFNYNNINKEINSYKISLIILIQRQCRKRFKNKKKKRMFNSSNFSWLYYA